MQCLNEWISNNAIEIWGFLFTTRDAKFKKKKNNVTTYLADKEHICMFMIRHPVLSSLPFAWRNKIYEEFQWNCIRMYKTNVNSKLINFHFIKNKNNFCVNFLSSDYCKIDKYGSYIKFNPFGRCFNMSMQKGMLVAVSVYFFNYQKLIIWHFNIKIFPHSTTISTNYILWKNEILYQYVSFACKQSHMTKFL